MPQRSFKQNIEAAQKQFKGKLIPNLLTTFSQNRLPKSFFFFFFFFFFRHPPHLISLIDRKPGDIQALTDFMLEDYKNFPKVPEFGEETARYIRKEMEDTWGSDHLSVLPEDEAQHWILGVGTLFSLLDQEWFLVPSKTPQVLQNHIKRLNTRYKQASCHFPLEFLQLLQSNLANPWCPSPPLFLTIRIEFPPLLQLASTLYL